MKQLNHVLGVQGEVLAKQHLLENGYKILAQNYTTKIGEIDIIASKNDIIVFVEVKRRQTLQYGRPIEAVDIRKQNKIRKVAEIYLMLNDKVSE